MAATRLRRNGALGALRAPLLQRHRAAGHVRADHRTGLGADIRNRFTRRLGRPAAALALLLGLAVVAGLIAIVAISVLAQYDELVDSLSQAKDDIVERLEGEPFNLSFDRTGDVSSSLADFSDEAFGYAVAGVQTGLAVVAGRDTGSRSPLLHPSGWGGVMGLDLRRFTPESRPAIDRAGRHAWAELSGFIQGTALIAFIDASLIGVGLWLLGVPVAFALAVLVFIGAFVPFVGAFLSGLVAVLVAFAGWRLEDWARRLGARVGRPVPRGELPSADHPEPYRRPSPCGGLTRGSRGRFPLRHRRRLSRRPCDRSRLRRGGVAPCGLVPSWLYLSRPRRRRRPPRSADGRTEHSIAVVGAGLSR